MGSGTSSESSKSSGPRYEDDPRLPRHIGRARRGGHEERIGFVARQGGGPDRLGRRAQDPSRVACRERGGPVAEFAEVEM